MTLGCNTGSDASSIVVSVVIGVAILYAAAWVVWVDFAEFDLCEDCSRKLVEYFVDALACERANFHACWNSVL